MFLPRSQFDKSLSSLGNMLAEVVFLRKKAAFRLFPDLIPVRSGGSVDCRDLRNVRILSPKIHPVGGASMFMANYNGWVHFWLSVRSIFAQTGLVFPPNGLALRPVPIPTCKPLTESAAGLV